MRHFKIKNIFSYMVVAALVAALSISCKSNEEPKDNTHSNHPSSGTYTGTVGSSSSTGTVTITGGACNIRGTAFDNSGNQQLNYDITITKWYNEAGYSESIVSVGGEATPRGEATVAAPTGYTSFSVNYNGNTIRVGFQVAGTWYSTSDMTRQ